MTKEESKINISNFVTNTVLRDYEDITFETATTFITKAFDTGLIATCDVSSINDWYQNIFIPNLFILDESEYTEACIQALKVQFTMAGTDFGTSRQRDLGQKWSDTIRGYLGEFGVQKLLKSKYELSIELGHELGTAQEYLDSDIRYVEFKGQTKRLPKIKVSIKTTKANGIWLDIPGDQFHHSQLYVLALIGVDTNHLFSFFKHLSVFKDKILKKGVDSNCITQDEANSLYDQVPSFKKIYGYVPGIIDNSSSYDSYKFSGRKGRTKYILSDWTGKYEQGYLEEIKQIQSVDKVEFLGIGNFSNSGRYIFGLPSLKNRPDDWNKLFINKI